MRCDDILDYAVHMVTPLLLAEKKQCCLIPVVIVFPYRRLNRTEILSLDILIQEYPLSVYSSRGEDEFRTLMSEVLMPSGE